MKNSYPLSQQNFENLLRWLSADREEAGIKYEEIRKGLIRFFDHRGCGDPLSLADETFNRVALKIPKNVAEMEKFSVGFIYGFAVNIHKEYVRLNAKKEVELNLNLPLAAINPKDFTDTENKEVNCLNQCLKKMSAEESELLVRYYSEFKSAKFDHRKKIAKELKITTGALHTKVFRLKNRLKKCIEKCVSEKNL